MSKKITLQRHYLGNKYPGIYFTKTEVQCLECFIAGFTNRKTAEALNLSDRTVEFYLNNMKEKLTCSTKKQLIEKFLNQKKNVKIK